MKIRRSLLKDVVSVRSFSGETAYGPSYADPVDVACNVDAKRRLVRSSGGEQVVSEVTLHAHPESSELFTPESQVTVLGRPTQVIDAKTHTLRGKPVFVEVTCA